ncbi:hypothetical protein DL98DRAFT_439425 [Cadophora sp. DSE1049]|nr:hypothetical protein DL98DRAFT_439425 [Cadophora sp. DSE1049]
MQHWAVNEPYLDMHCSLGEGPHYEPSTNCLRFVDIRSRRLHSVNLSSGPSSLTSTEFTIPVSFTADIQGVDPSKTILVGGKSGVYLLDRRSGELQLLKSFHTATVDEKRASRLSCNDGAVDSNGQLWLGTMTDFDLGPPKAEGCLYFIDSKLCIIAKRKSLIVPNGIGWAPDHNTLYFIHPSDRQVLAFTTSGSGDIQNERVLYQHDGEGEPDGLRVDIEGNLWIAIYGEGRVLKISPVGEIIGEVTYLTPLITCHVFIGSELGVTTADDEKSEFGGGIFKVDVGVEGMEIYTFKLEVGI